MIRMQFSFVLCLGCSAFLLVDLTSHGQRHPCPVRRHTPRSGKFVFFCNHPSVAIGKGVTVEVATGGCHCCSSKLCSSSGTNKVTFLLGQLAASHQLPSAKLVLHRDCAVQKNEVAEFSQKETGWFCVREDMAFLTVDL